MENTKKEFKHGDNCIKLTIQFFANGTGQKKLAWLRGEARVVTNKSRGIREGHKKIFNHSYELVPAIIYALNQAEVNFKTENGDLLLPEKAGFDKLKN